MQAQLRSFCRHYSLQLASQMPALQAALADLARAQSSVWATLHLVFNLGGPGEGEMEGVQGGEGGGVGGGEGGAAGLMEDAA